MVVDETLAWPPEPGSDRLPAPRRKPPVITETFRGTPSRHRAALVEHEILRSAA